MNRSFDSIVNKPSPPRPLAFPKLMVYKHSVDHTGVERVALFQSRDTGVWLTGSIKGESVSLPAKDFIDFVGTVSLAQN